MNSFFNALKLLILCSKVRLYQFIYLSAMILVFAIFLFHLGFVIFPLLCVLLGILLRFILKKNHLLVFSFLIPILPAFAGFIDSGFPHNYLILPLLVLTGIVIADSIINKKFLAAGKETIPLHYIYYLLILSISFLFVMLRWSNLTLSPLAFFKDTPIAPTGQRISFGIIFPVVELALFSLSPLYYLLLKRQHDMRRILIAFLSGQSLSIIYSLHQRLQTKVSPEIILRGLASDATAFGFLSALSILLSWYLYFRYNFKKLGLLFFFISLFGMFNSMTRIGLLAVILVFFLFIFSVKKKVLSFLLIGALLAISLFLYIHFLYEPGFNILTRLKSNYRVFSESFKQGKIDLSSVQNLTSGRDRLLRYSWESLRSFPLTGVGTGNFVFWVMYAHNGDFLHHLPANQYFFISSSTGLFGLLIFLFFCSGLFSGKKWPEKWLLGMFLFLLLFNDYLWFSEIFLVFWLFASLGEKSEKKSLILSKRAKTLYICSFLVFSLFNLLKFSDLHPKNWARETSTLYDYGFSYPETERGRSFRWSGENAGFYVFLDKNNPRTEYKLVCEAPLFHLPGKRLSVDVYWRGKLYRRLVFRENKEYYLQLVDVGHTEGFLEFRVRPAFNLKKMGLGAESRDLGVQVSARTVNFCVDANKEQKEGIYEFYYLTGWVYVNDQETKGQEVYVQFEKPDGTVMQYSTMSLERPDVGAFFKTPLYNNSGFSVLIPLNDESDFDLCTIRFVVKNKHGIYKSQVWKTGIKVNSHVGIEAQKKTKIEAICFPNILHFYLIHFEKSWFQTGNCAQWRESYCVS